MENGSISNEKKHENGIAKALMHPMASFLAAFRFLTVIPIGWKSEADGDFFQSSLLWFPLIGLLIGGAGASVTFIVAGWLPVNVTVVLAMLILAGISGFLHLDGLADSGDGLLSSRPRERALLIMRDSHTGAMGMIAVFFVLLGKYAALSSLSATALCWTVFLIPIAGRVAILLSMALLPYARLGDGLGRLFYSSDTWKVALAGFLFCTGIVALVSIQYILFVVMAIVITVALFSLWCFKKLGGATGDTLGAICELTELTCAVAIVLAS